MVSAMMEPFTPTEAWLDQKSGNLAVRTTDGGYKVFIDPTSMYIEATGLFGAHRREALSDTDYMRNRVIDVKTQILNAKESKK